MQFSDFEPDDRLSSKKASRHLEPINLIGPKLCMLLMDDNLSIDVGDFNVQQIGRCYRFPVSHSAAPSSIPGVTSK